VTWLLRNSTCSTRGATVRVVGDAHVVEGWECSSTKSVALGLGDPQPAVDVDEALEAGLAAEAVRTADGLGDERGRWCDVFGLTSTLMPADSLDSFSRMIAADAESAWSWAG
jgi:hypothetical protein